LIFTDSNILVNALSNEQHSLANLLENIGLNEKYEHNGHLKKSFHAMRAFVSSQIYQKTRDSEYSHAYLGHDTYLNQYLRKSPEERAKMFSESESALTIFNQISQPSNNDEKLEKMSSTIQMLQGEIEILKSERNRFMIQ